MSLWSVAIESKKAILIFRYTSFNLTFDIVYVMGVSWVGRTYPYICFWDRG